MRLAPSWSTPNSRRRKALIWSCILGKMRARASCSVLSRSKIHTRRDGGSREMRTPASILFAADEGAAPLFGEALEQQRVRHAAVDDVHALDAISRRVERRADLG